MVIERSEVERVGKISQGRREMVRVGKVYLSQD